jgi:hypothetical protein
MQGILFNDRVDVFKNPIPAGIILKANIGDLYIQGFNNDPNLGAKCYYFEERVGQVYLYSQFKGHGQDWLLETFRDLFEAGIPKLFIRLDQYLNYYQYMTTLYTIPGSTLRHQLYASNMNSKIIMPFLLFLILQVVALFCFMSECFAFRFLRGLSTRTVIVKFCLILIRIYYYATNELVRMFSNIKENQAGFRWIRLIIQKAYHRLTVRLCTAFKLSITKGH